MSAAVRVEHDAAGSRFVAALDEGEGVLAYRKVGEKTLDLQHTVVPEAARGDGVGDALVRAALDHARAHGMTVVPTCPFVAVWLKAHPDQQSLVAQQ